MIASTQITNAEICQYITVLVFKLLSRIFFYKQRQQKLLRSGLLLDKRANFTGKLL